MSAANKSKMSDEGDELLKAVQQMKKGKKGRVYTEEQLLAISARKSVNLTQRQFAELLNVSVNAVQDWEQGRRSPRGAAKTLLKIAQAHPVPGGLMIIAKYPIKSQTSNELAVAYHPLNEGNQHPPCSTDQFGHETPTSWRNEERYR